MCGIAGIYNSDISYSVNRQILKNMTDILSHRGPDEDGYYIANEIGLGHRRLSIIDLAGGKQPLHNEDSTIWVIFNGEIFNYVELMDLLRKKGHTFYTRSDTEVLVHLYEEYGKDFVSHCNGQFAIALWDSNKKELVLARDRMGIRPLYFTQLTDKTVLFGSEMKSLFCHPQMPAELDMIGLEQVYSLWVTIPPRTIFKNVNELAPGSLLIVNKNGMNTYKYWKPKFPDKNCYEQKPLTYYSNRLKELLYDAVTIRLRSDVPVAAYLSGGLDSSIITALVKKYHNNNLITFSVAFKDSAYDESRFQNTMVEYLKTDHRSITVDYSSIGSVFSDVIWHTEYPMIRTAPAPLFALSGLVRKNNIKVVLTGEGADEVFGGYNIFKENRLRRFWARYPQSTIRPQLLTRLYPYILKENKLGSFWQQFFKRNLTELKNPYYSHLIRWSNTSRINRFLTKEYQSQLNESEHIYEELKNYIDPDIDRWDPLCQSQYLEMVLFMSGYLLSSQGDRMMMGNSVEGRFPFLDYRVVEFGSTVPPDLKINILNEKYLLKKTYEDLVPISIIERSKQPYRAPIAQCFLNEHNEASNVINNDSLVKSGIFDPSSVALLKSKLTNSNQDISATDDMTVAAIVSTQLLHHHFIKPLTDTKKLHWHQTPTVYSDLITQIPPIATSIENKLE